MDDTKDALLKKLAKLLLSRRKEIKLTQEQVAERADLALRFYQRLEHAEKGASLETIFKLSHALRVKPVYFVEPLWGVWESEYTRKLLEQKGEVPE